jgi:microcystin degradation protein MlrC
MLRGPYLIEQLAATRTEFGGVCQVARERGVELVPLLSARATASGGPLLADVFAALRDELVGQLRVAGPLDGVFMILHGAMVAESC